jgi:hypothetical protein
MLDHPNVKPSSIFSARSAEADAAAEGNPWPPSSSPSSSGPKTTQNPSQFSQRNDPQLYGRQVGQLAFQGEVSE